MTHGFGVIMVWFMSRRKKP